jgi:outer membrane biosynthesis protein TonB
MEESKKNRMISLIATLIFHVVVVVALIFSFLHYQYPPKDADQFQMTQPQDTILFGGQYVMLGNVQQPAEQNMSNTEPAKTEQDKAETQEGEDMKDAGDAGVDTRPNVQSKQESPMKVKEKKVDKQVKTGPSKADLARQEREKAARAATDKKVKNAFGGKSNGNGGGKQGSPNGNSSRGVLSGTPGVSGLVGYTLASWGRPHSTVDGTVKVRVRVNARGHVIEAHYAGGSGAAAANASTRASCEAAARQSAFSVPKNTTTEAVGYIIYHIE